MLKIFFKRRPSFYLRRRAELKKGSMQLLRNTILDGLSPYLLKLFLEAFPESCIEKDNSGRILLHHACDSNLPFFTSYVKALLNVDNNNTDFLTVQDDHGVTPLRLLTQRASKQDENMMLPLHYLAATLNGLTVKSLQLLVDAYPESIRTADKFGNLPFHYACLNPASSLEVLMLLINMSPEVIVVNQIQQKQQLNRIKSHKRRRLQKKYV
jgi:ankyrin repeat protein